MVYKAHQIIFITLVAIISLTNCELPQEWTTEDLIDYLSNSTYSEKDYLIFDPHEDLKNESQKIIPYYQELLKDYSIGLYFIDLKKIKEIDIEEVVANYSFGAVTEDSSKSIFIICEHSTLKYIHYIGDNIPKEITTDFLESLYEQTRKSKTSIYFSYKDLKIIVNGIRNKFITPENGWTPENLSSKLTEYYKKNKTYGSFDINLISEPDEVELNCKIQLEDFKSKKTIYPFIIAITHIDDSYLSKNKTINDFLDELLINTSIPFIPDYIDKKETIFYLVEKEKNLFSMKLGSNLPSLTEEEYKKIQGHTKIIDNIATIAANLFDETLFYLVGEKMGWTPEILSHQIKRKVFTMTSSFFYSEFLINFPNSSYAYEIMSVLLESNINTFSIYINKLDDNYDDANTFLTELQKIYVPSSATNDSILYILVVIGKNNSLALYLGKNVKSYVPDEKYSIIVKVGEYLLSQNKVFEATMSMLRIFRLNVNIRPKGMVPSSLAYLLNDIGNGCDYFLYDYIEKFTEEELKLLNSSFEYNNNLTLHIYFATIQSYKEKINITLDEYTEQVFDILKQDNIPTGVISDYLFLIIYSEKENEISFKQGKEITKYFTIQNKKKIYDAMEKYTKLTDKILELLRYVRLYGYMFPGNWDSKKINIYNKDWVGPVTSEVFDPTEHININLVPTFKAYFKETENYGANIFFFNIYEYDYNSNEDLLEDLKKNLIVDGSVNKENMVIITFELYMEPIETGDFNFYAGNNVKDILTSTIFYSYIDSIIDLLNENKFYEAFKILFFKLRKLFKDNKQIIGESYTPKKLRDLLQNDFEFSPYLLSDYYSMFNQTEEMKLFNMSKYIYESYNIESYFFILESVDTHYTKDNMDDFGKELYNNLTFEKLNKEQILLIAYFKKDNLMTMYPGNTLKHFLTVEHSQDICYNATKEIKETENYLQALLFVYSNISITMRVKHYYSPSDIEFYFKEKLDTPEHFIFDPHINLGVYNKALLNVYLDKLEKKKLFVYTYLISEYNPSKFDDNNKFEEYFEAVVNSTPIRKENLKSAISYIMHCTTTGEFLIKMKNKKLSQKKINTITNNYLKIIKEKSIYDGLNYVYKELDKSVHTGNKNVWKIVAIVASCLLVLGVIFFLLIKFLKKGGNTVLEKSNKYQNIDNVEKINID